MVCLNVSKTRDWEGTLMPIDVLIFEDMRRAGLTFQSRVVWTVPHGLTPAARLADRYETVLIFSKGEQAAFNPNAARVPQKQPGKRAFKGPNIGQLSGNPLGAYPSDVWSDIPNVGHNHPDTAEGKHPAQFPGEAGKALHSALQHGRRSGLRSVLRFWQHCSGRYRVRPQLRWCGPLLRGSARTPSCQSETGHVHSLAWRKRRDDCRLASRARRVEIEAKTAPTTNEERQMLNQMALFVG